MSVRCALTFASSVYSTNAYTASLSGVLMGMVDTVLADIKVKPFRVKQARIHNSILY